jgi:mannose-6-phosphate isomerase-like protein (cupin superfamily)
MNGFIDDIEDRAERNRDFRRVLYTGTRLQLAVMSLLPDEQVAGEVPGSDQFFHVEEGHGDVSMDGRTTLIESGMGMLVPAGTRHCIRNTGARPMKLYALSAPPFDAVGTVNRGTHGKSAAADVL